MTCNVFGGTLNLAQSKALPVLYVARDAIILPVPLLRHASSGVLVTPNQATAIWLAVLSRELLPLVGRLLARAAAYMHIQRSNRHRPIFTARPHCSQCRPLY